MLNPVKYRYYSKQNQFKKLFHLHIFWGMVNYLIFTFIILFVLMPEQNTLSWRELIWRTIFEFSFYFSSLLTINLSERESSYNIFFVKRWHGWKVRMTLHKLHLSIFTRKGLFFVAALKSETICLTCKRNTKVILQKLSEFKKNEYFSTPTTC
jgi:hypothetical protein